MSVNFAFRTTWGFARLHPRSQSTKSPRHEGGRGLLVLCAVDSYGIYSRSRASSPHGLGPLFGLILVTVFSSGRRIGSGGQRGIRWGVLKNN